MGSYLPVKQGAEAEFELKARHCHSLQLQGLGVHTTPNASSDPRSTDSGAKQQKAKTSRQKAQKVSAKKQKSGGIEKGSNKGKASEAVKKQKRSKPDKKDRRKVRASEHHQCCRLQATQIADLLPTAARQLMNSSATDVCVVPGYRISFQLCIGVNRSSGASKQSRDRFRSDIVTAYR